MKTKSSKSIQQQINLRLKTKAPIAFKDRKACRGKVINEETA